ncbi:MAG TPA: hypothetical protein VFM96_07945 [Gaiellaceae bacterium]|nr:hypothetical protein [Gaiellaceae bacterium]
MTSKPRRYFDPEALEEIDLGRHLRFLGSNWWVVALGIVFGAIVGFALAVGHGQTYVGTASLYLGQPFGGSGDIALQDPQTNPSTLDQIVHSFAIDERVARACKAKPDNFSHGISTLQVAGSSLPNHQNPHVTLSVLAQQPRLAQCAAKGLALAAVNLLASYARLKIATDHAQIATDNRQIERLQASLASDTYSAAGKALLTVDLRSLESDRVTTTQLLEQTTKVEVPELLASPRAEHVTARTTRASTFVAALIGAIFGIVAALGGRALIQRRRRA